MPAASLVTSSQKSAVPENAGDGLLVGQVAASLVGFYGATPVAQQATGGAAVSATTATTTSPWGFATSTQANAIVTLVNGLQTSLINLGLISS